MRNYAATHANDGAAAQRRLNPQIARPLVAALVAPKADGDPLDFSTVPYAKVSGDDVVGARGDATRYFASLSRDERLALVKEAREIRRSIIEDPEFAPLRAKLNFKDNPAWALERAISKNQLHEDMIETSLWAGDATDWRRAAALYALVTTDAEAARWLVVVYEKGKPRSAIEAVEAQVNRCFPNANPFLEAMLLENFYGRAQKAAAGLPRVVAEARKAHVDIRDITTHDSENRVRFIEERIAKAKP